MLAEWTDVKSVIVGRGLSAQYTVVGSNYWIKAIDGVFEVECLLPTDTSSSADSLDFVTNFKPAANKIQIQETSVQNQPPYGSKAITINGVAKRLYARNVGWQTALTSGANTITYTATFAWTKMLGVEVINCEPLDFVDFKVYDTATGTYSGTPNQLLNQFAYSHNLAKDFYQRLSQFDADLYAGMVIQITYTSVSAKTVGINLLLDEVKAS